MRLEITYLCAYARPREPRALFDAGVFAIVPGFELLYEPAYEAVAEGLGEAFAPVFDAGRADARSGRALTPDDRGARG